MGIWEEISRNTGGPGKKKEPKKKYSKIAELLGVS